MIEAKDIYKKLEESIKKDINFLDNEYLNIRAGKASINILQGITVESYGAMMPIDNIASVTVPDSKTVLIQPWDRGVIGAIEKAIVNSNIGVTPSNNGEQIRLNLPPLTEERRLALAKQVKTLGENSKVNIRNNRRDAIEAFKKAKKDGMSEDAIKDGEAEVQKIIDKAVKRVDELGAIKEKEIMTV